MPKRKTLFEAGNAESDNSGNEEEQTEEAVAKKPKIQYRRRKVLLLGSGFCAQKITDVLIQNECDVTIASRNFDQAKAISKQFLLWSNAQNLDLALATDKEKFTNLVDSHDLVIAMVPETYFELVAEVCLEKSTPLLIPEEATEGVKNLFPKFKEAATPIVHGLGVSPGVDHMLAQCLHQNIVEKKGKIKGLKIYQGIVPAPQCIDNSLMYKFTFNPEQSILQYFQGKAKFLKESDPIEQSNPLSSPLACDFINKGLNLEYTASTVDSAEYVSPYQWEGLSNIERNTVRYRGFHDTLQALNALGWFNKDPVKEGVTGETTWLAALSMQLPEGKLQENNICTIANLEPEAVALLEKYSSHCAMQSEVQITSKAFEEASLFLQQMGFLNPENKVQLQDSNLKTFIAQCRKSHMDISSEDIDLVILQVRGEYEVEEKKDLQTEVAEMMVMGGPKYSGTATVVGSVMAYSGLMLLDSKKTGEGEIPEEWWGDLHAYDPRLAKHVLDMLARIGVSVKFQSL